MFKKDIFKSTILMSIGVACLAGCQSIPKSQIGGAERFVSNENLSSNATEKAFVGLSGAVWSETDGFGVNISEAVKSLHASNNYPQGRNEMQDYLISVSNNNCARFKTQALSIQSNTNFLLGSVATAFSTAGALVNPESTAKALSGASGALTGIQSKYGENFFREKAFEVITRAINVRRKELLGNINDRQKLDEKEYTINRALADAVLYNNACSLIEGLEELNDAVSESNEVVDAATAASEQDDNKKFGATLMELRTTRQLQ